MAQPLTLNNHIITIYPDLHTLSRAAAEEVFQRAWASISLKGFFALALSGGSTPIGLHNVLARDYHDKIPWERVHFFWGDERFVPYDDPESNYKMALDTLLSKIDVPNENIHPINTSYQDPEEAAQAYEAEIKEFLNGHGMRGLDLSIMGIGADGHTASLFPHDKALYEKDRLVLSTTAPPIYRTRKRITFSVPLINNSEQIMYLLSGKDKNKVLRALFRLSAPDPKIPASFIKTREKIGWHLDKEAGENIWKRE